MFTVANSRIISGPLWANVFPVSTTLGGPKVVTGLCVPTLATFALRRGKPFRSIATRKIDSDAAEQMLNQQRLKRPIAPHLGAYQVSQTWMGTSIWMRFTGVGLMGATYGYFISYALSPVFGWHVDSESIVAAFASVSTFPKVSMKFGLAFPFVFHFVNGIKQLAYDMGYGWSRQMIIASNVWPWIVSFIGAAFLTFSI